MKQRILYLDSLRGVLILLVVLGHCLQTGDYENSRIWNFIYAFHMAAFMAVSGFVGYRDELQITDIIKRAKELVLPFFCWSLLSISLSGKPVLSSLGYVLLHPDCGLWFLWVLFIIIVLVHVGDRLSKLLKVKQELVFAVLTLSLVGIMVVMEFRLLGFQFIAYYFMFYLIGFYAKKYAIMDKMLPPPRDLLYLLYF